MAELQEKCSNLLVRQFENKHNRRSWENKDNSARLKFVEDCIRIVGVFERLNQSSRFVWKEVFELEETLSAIRNGEEMLWVIDMNTDDMKEIAEELRMNTSLLSLWFSLENQIGLERAQHLSDALRQNSTLLFLNIGDCKIGPEGARHLSDTLRQNSSLLFLDIGGNEFGPEGSRHLSDVLRENCTLLYLHVQGNEIGDDGARYLSDALQENCTLLYLDIQDNQIGDDGARHLSDMLRENCTLMYLDISGSPFRGGNQIGDDGARHLSDILRQNSTLLYLYIGWNQIGPEGARHLSDMLRQNSTLLYMDIQFNNLRDRKLESHIRNEIRSRESSSSPSWQLSFEECRLFLRSNFSVQSWTSVRQDTFLHLDFDQLPPEMWGEILGFLSNDSSSLHESILTFDLRSGFYFPYPTCKFSSQEIPLLSMIPCIEGVFRLDQWTKERLYRARLRKPSSIFEEMRRHWNLEESSKSSSDFEL